MTSSGRNQPLQEGPPRPDQILRPRGPTALGQDSACPRQQEASSGNGDVFSISFQSFP